MVAFDLVDPSAEQVELSSAEFKTFNSVADKLGIERVKIKKGINVRSSLNELPSLVTPCADLNALRMLVDLQYELGILTDESISFLHVPEDFDINEV